MNKGAKHKRYSTRELEEKSIPICLNCPMADCMGSASCGYLRSRLDGKADAKKKPAKKWSHPAKCYVEYEGKQYTLRQMAEMSGSELVMTKNRYYRGWTGEEMMQGYMNPKRKPEGVKGNPIKEAEKYEYNGQYYTANEMSVICGVSRQTVYNRLHNGWTVGEILQNHRDGKKEYPSRRAKEATTHEEPNSGAESERESRSDGA